MGHYATTTGRGTAPLTCTTPGCTRPRLVTDSGRVYFKCQDCRREEQRRYNRERYQREQAEREQREREREREQAAPPAPDVQEPAPSQQALMSLADSAEPPAPVSGPMSGPLLADSRDIPRASDSLGVLADLLLITDRSRAAIAAGEIDGLRLAVDIRGVRVHFGTTRINNEREDGE